MQDETKNKISGPPQFEEIEHTADKSLRIYGDNLCALLINAARGMNSLMTAELCDIAVPVKKHLKLDAFDAESLLVEWLSELAFWAETEMLIFIKFEFQNLTDTSAEVTVLGGKVPRLEKHIKAVTYHNLKIIETERGLEATVVFDV
jgi:SHS2 domain-containing protein